ncbi:MAG: helix-turn-helix domain-containing protein [Candidatus Pacebacteria bacterium]|nr:helix-turn-helix domain-containing protein [Candidatus Paceibacterota bacterium]
MKNEYLKLKTSLTSFGFSKKEADVYIAILELGKGTVSQISRKAGINRTTGYDILNSLLNKNVVSVSGKEPKQEYSAESPTNITEYLKKQAAALEEQIKESESLVPELNILHSKKNRPKIRFYEGIEGLKKVYEDTLTSPETIRAYATIDDMHKALPNYFPEYYKRRAAKNIFILGIVPETELGKERSRRNTEEKREISFVPADKYYFSPEINIYGNKIMIASWREKLGIIIESEEIADAMKKIHDLAWIGSKHLEE